jgi:hypothetical protein
MLSHNLPIMKSKILTPIIAMLLVVFMGSCQKEQSSNSTPASSSQNNFSKLNIRDQIQQSSNSTPASSSQNKLGSTMTLSKKNPDKAVLQGVNLGVAGNFVILTKTGITSVYKSTITGDIGTSPITGAAMVLSCGEVTGNVFSVDAAGPACKITSPTMLTSAVSDMQTAYTDAAGRINPDFLNLGAGTIGGLTLTPGLYKWTSSVNIPTDIVIAGGPNDVWIFQVAGTLKMSSAVKVTLRGGAQAKNIYWQVAGAVTFGTTSHFEGIILGQTGINLQTGASINGRLLAQTAATLQMNTVTQP